MPRARQRKKHWLTLVPPFAGLFLLGWIYAPPFRTLAVWAIALAVVVGAVALFVYFARKILQRDRAITESPYIIIPQPSQASATPILPVRFTSELLDVLEWRRFEMLVTQFFQHTGYEARRNRVGADGGVDIIVCHPGEAQPSGYVQCKAWHTYTVGVKPVRELLGVMTADKVPHGFLVTIGGFTAEAIEFARQQPIVLVGGLDLLKDLNQLPEATRKAIMADITSGDYTTPTCPRCDQKMVNRKGPKGDFWGCSNYPRCRQTFNVQT